MVAPSAAGLPPWHVLCGGLSGATQGLGVPPEASGPRGGEMKSPEVVAPTPAPIGIAPPPKPPDVLGQHSSASTQVHPSTSLPRRRAAIEPNNRRIRMG